MYPKDNIFNIYYNIGKRLPFQVKRCEIGVDRSKDEETMYSQKGRSYLVERILPRGNYGKAYGKCLIDGKPSNEYSNDEEMIPCAGCGEWVLLDVPGVNMNDIFPERQPDFVIEFGKYKGKNIREIYEIDPQYIFWLIEKDHYFRVNFFALLNLDPNTNDIETIIAKEINRIFPKTTVDSFITFGKYKGRTFKDVYKIDPSYIDWFLRINRTIEIDQDSFISMMK